MDGQGRGGGRLPEAGVHRTAAHTQVVIGTGAELIATIPTVLGFTPGPGSLVVVCGPDADGRSGPVLRVDVPDLLSSNSRGGAELDAAMPPAWGPPQHLAEFCAREGITAAWLVIVQPRCLADADEHTRVRDTVEEIEWWLGSVGVHVGAAYGVERFRAGERYAGLLGTDDGVQQDPAGTHLAAIHAYRGVQRYESREEVEELYRRRDPGAVDVDTPGSVPSGAPGWGSLNADASHPQHTGHGDGLCPRVPERHVPWRGVSEHTRVARALDDGCEPTAEQLERVGNNLRNVLVRDGILAGLERDPLRENDGRRELWWRIARRRPAQERSVALCLLGWAAYGAGSGVHARAALNEALRADPGNRLAALTLQALDLGLRPELLRFCAGEPPAPGERRAV